MESQFKQKSFWSRPEGVTGGLILGGIIAGGSYLLYKFLPVLIGMLSNTLYLAGMLIILGALIYIALDPKAEP